MARVRRPLPGSARLLVSFAATDVAMMRRELCLAPSFFAAGVVEGTRLTFPFSLDDIEELQGAVAAEANHATNRTLRDRLDRIFERLQEVLNTYDDGNDR
ncbi:hypothetical protein L6Q96_19045 [Candidatus Binatia bacterium]|nr:hypothetical protein [Candidatus Binatia bacterium]